MRHPALRASLLVLLVSGLSACSGGLFRAGSSENAQVLTPEARAAALAQREEQQQSIFDLFGGGDDENTTVEVNKYLWIAAQDILDFLPIEAVDPFTGVIVYGYGTPPGGGRAYRATVYVQDPALEARSIKVAMATRSGPVPRATSRAIEDAILTRARQLRVQDGNL